MFRPVWSEQNCLVKFYRNVRGYTSYESIRIVKYKKFGEDITHITEEIFSKDVENKIYFLENEVIYEIKDNNYTLLRVESKRSKHKDDENNIYHLTIECAHPTLGFKNFYHTLDLSIPLKNHFQLKEAVISRKNAEFLFEIGDFIYHLIAVRTPCHSCGVSDIWQVIYEHIKKIK